MQLPIFIIGGICLLILSAHLFMRNAYEHSVLVICEKIVIACVGLVTIVWGAIPEFVMLANKADDKVKGDLLKTSGKVCDDNGHIVDIDITDENDIDVLSVKNIIKTDEYYIVYSVFVDVKVSQGYLRGVPVIIEKNMFGSDTIVKWDYNLNDKTYYYEEAIRKREGDPDADPEYYQEDQDSLFGFRHYIDFEFSNAPAYTVGDILEYIGVKGSYEVAKVCVTSVTDNYDALEYYALWRDKNSKIRQKGWVRAVYNKELKQWELCDAEKKMTSLDSELAEYASERDDTYNNDYTDDFVIIEDAAALYWAEIE